MPPFASSYDIAIIGGGHNGLVAAAYLARAGLSVLVLERNAVLGGATQSKEVFPGLDARLSVYSYLVSLFPPKIINDLGLNLRLTSRAIASYTPVIDNGGLRELLIRNDAPRANQAAFRKLTGSDQDYAGYLDLQDMHRRLARVLWPSLVEPMITRRTMRSRLDAAGQRAWQALIEEPLGHAIEGHIDDDLIRGLLFTDARIGLSTYPHDPSLLQNRCYLYHVIGQGSGEWHVPLGGMGALVDDLVRVSNATGRVTFATDACVTRIHPDTQSNGVRFEQNESTYTVDARYVLCNASKQVLNDLTNALPAEEKEIEGAGFKINMLLKRLPRLTSDSCTSAEAFAGTFHIDEGYEQMLTSYRESMAGSVPTNPPGEIYCHTLTDDSILSPELNQQGYHTLTLFGLDLPYSLFAQNNDRVRKEVLDKYLAGFDRFLDEPLKDCLAIDADGQLCIEVMSAADLEQNLHLPKGNIFHGDLSWPFVEEEAEAGQWGVETEHPRVFICGSAAKRGGAVSGIPGHNAAMKVLECLRDDQA